MRSCRLGILSIASGVLAMVLVFASNHWRNFIYVGEGMFLNWATQVGVVKEPPRVDSFDSFNSPSLLSFTDEKALSLLTGTGVALGSLAIALAFFAERRRESSLYLATGFICGCGGLLLWQPVASFASLLVGAFAILRVRHAKA